MKITQKSKGKLQIFFWFLVFALSFAFGRDLVFSSAIPDSLIEKLASAPTDDVFLSFKSSLSSLGFSFRGEGTGFDLPCLECIISLEKPLRVRSLGRRRLTLDARRWRLFESYPGIAERKGLDETPDSFNFNVYPRRSRDEGISPFKVTDTSFFCGEKVARLSVYPFTIDQETGLLVYEPCQFEVSLPDGEIKRGREGSGWHNFFARFPHWFKIKIDSTGIYKVTGRELERAGLSLSSVSPEGFKLFNIGRFSPPLSYPDTMVEIPIYVYTGQDGSFDPDDYILFYGEGVSRWDERRTTYREDIFSLYNYYWLTYSHQPGKRIPVSENPPTGREGNVLTRRHFEKEILCPPRGGTLWLWDMISVKRGESRGSKSFSFSVPEGESLRGVCFRIFSAGRSFVVRSFLNGVFLDSEFVRSANVPDGRVIRVEKGMALTKDVVLEIEVSTTGDGDLDVFLDWVELSFTLKKEIERAVELVCYNSGDFVFLSGEGSLLLDVTEPLAPKFLSFNKRGDSLFFSVSSDSSIVLICPFSRVRRALAIERRSELSTSVLPNLSAEFFIVAPEAFRRLANVFADYRRRSSSLSVGVALLEEIYDVYLFGIEEPYAIKRFFREKAPIYGLLLGDGSYDYRGIFGAKGPGIPPYEYGSGFSYEVYERYPLALDAFYADFEDLALPLYPDFVLGRIPCRSEREGMAYLEKVREYEKGVGDYRLRFLFAGDDEYLGDPYSPDNCGLGVHIASCEFLAGLIPNFFEVKKVYLTEYPLSQVKDKPEARRAFADELADGVLGVVYFGHGAGFRLAHEQLLNIEDVFNLSCFRQYPFGFFGSCGVGRFDDFELGRYREAIAEDLVRHRDGFIATIACTKASSPATNERLAQTFLSALFSGRGLGESFFLSQVYDISYHYFGDPTLIVSLPERRFLPQVSSSLRAKEAVSFSCSLGTRKERVFSSRVFYGKRWRRYTSTVFFNQNPYIFQMNYTLPGFRVFAEKRREVSDFYRLRVFPPRGIPLDTVGDENNFYLEIPKTARVISFVQEKESSYCLLWDSIVRDTLEGEREDNNPPLIRLFAEGRELSDSSFLPKSFLLSGELVDESGIYLSSYRFYPRVFLPSGEINLSPILKEDYRGRMVFRLPLTLTAETTDLRLVCYDNFLNPGEKVVRITSFLQPRLIVSSPVSYGQKGNLAFTFTLSYPALVEIKVFSLSGRFVGAFSSFLASGRNTVSFPLSLRKGVYLYKLSAHSFSLNQKTEVYEKILVH